MTESFSDIGRVAALSRLYEESPFKAFQPLRFTSAHKARIQSASRLLLEGIDFDLVYFPLKHLGYKSVLSVTGELYAALAHPRTLSVIFGVSAKLDFAQIRALWSGVVTAAREQGFSQVDLDLMPSPNGLSISLSAQGETAYLSAGRQPVPQRKDLLCVSGRLGAAYLGLQVLERGKKQFDAGDAQPELEKYRMLIGAYLRPELDPQLLQHLEKAELYPSAGVFVTRGLSDAVKRLQRSTGLGVKVYADKIPFEGNSFALGRELDIDPISAAMNGGEDYQLLFTLPILSLEKFRRDFQTFDIIGHLAEPAVGTVLVTPDGVELPLRAQGWEQF